jgi:hypothetical protein
MKKKERRRLPASILRGLRESDALQGKTIEEHVEAEMQKFVRSTEGKPSIWKAFEFVRMVMQADAQMNGPTSSPMLLLSLPQSSSIGIRRRRRVMKEKGLMAEIVAFADEVASRIEPIRKEFEERAKQLDGRVRRLRMDLNKIGSRSPRLRVVPGTDQR